jgi:ankyrin repeat protein
VDVGVFSSYDGDLAQINRLLEEDGGRLNAQVQGYTRVDTVIVDGCTLLHLAAWRGHDAVVARLLGLGANMGLRNAYGDCATHWACERNRASCLALLLDAGASFNERAGYLLWTRLMVAASHGATECVQALLGRGGDTLELDATTGTGETALHKAAHKSHDQIIQLLLQAGANPTIRNNNGRTPLAIARTSGHQPCIVLLQASIAASHATCSLLKARALLDAALAIPKARTDAADKGDPPALQQEKALAAAPA